MSSNIDSFCEFTGWRNYYNNLFFIFSKRCGFVCMIKLTFITYLTLIMLTMFLYVTVARFIRLRNIDHGRVETNDFSGRWIKHRRSLAVLRLKESSVKATDYVKLHRSRWLFWVYIKLSIFPPSVYFVLKIPSSTEVTCVRVKQWYELYRINSGEHFSNVVKSS